MSGETSIERTQKRRLVAVLALTGAFCGVEAVMSFVAGSTVLKADALHLAMDVSALGMSLVAMRIAAARPTDRFTFGLHRAEPFAAVINAVLVLSGTTYIVSEAVEALRAPHRPLLGVMAVVSTIALVVNGISAWLLHGAIAHGHGHHHHGHHDHGHVHHHAIDSDHRRAHAHDHEHHDHGSHDHDDHDHDHAGHDHGDHDHEHHDHAATGKGADHSMNLRGAWLHVLGDALGSTAALATALAIELGAPPVIDPLASFLVAIFLVVGATRLLRDAAQVLLEGAPAHLRSGVVREVIRSVDGVDEVLDLRVWTLGAGHDATATRVRGSTDPAALAKRVESRLRDDLRVSHVWVHVETSADARVERG